MSNDVIRSFPIPPKRKASEEYSVSAEPIDNGPGVWNSNGVTIWRESENGTKTPVFEYVRNYGLGRTFEPFRQLQDGVWKDYALISSEYTRFEVVDLDKGEIVAVEPYPTITQEWLDGLSEAALAPGGWATEYAVGQERPGWGFCPVEFRVFDWRDKYSEESIAQTNADGKFIQPEAHLYAFTGQWAIYSGCLWGDDSSMKLRYIDLSKISEGVVTSDERFGYVPLYANLDEVLYSPYSDGFNIPVAIEASRTGKAVPIEVNWMTEEEYMGSDF